MALHSKTEQRFRSQTKSVDLGNGWRKVENNTCVEFFYDNLWHSDNKPAIKFYNKKFDLIVTWEWWSHGKRHRPNGPASYCTNTNGVYVPQSAEYWVNNVQMTFTEFKRLYEITYLKLYEHSGDSLPVIDNQQNTF